MKKLSIVLLLILGWNIEGFSSVSCNGPLSRIGRIKARLVNTAKAIKTYSKDAVKAQYDNLRHSGGVSLTGRLPNEKEALNPNDDILMGFFTAHRPKPEEKFWDAPFKNASQVVPRYVFTPVLKHLVRHRLNEDVRYNMPALNGVYRSLTRLLFDTKLFKNSKFYQKEFVPNWLTGIALTYVTPIGLYFTFFDPFRWFISAEESMENYTDEERYSKIIEYDPRFAEIKRITGSKERLKAAKDRYAEIVYFKRKLLFMTSHEGFFKEPSEESLIAVMQHLSSTDKSEFKPTHEQKMIIDRFEMAGVNEFKFIQNLSQNLASKVLNGYDESLGSSRKLVVRLINDEALCVYSCEDVNSVRMLDKSIRSLMKGYIRMAAVDALLFPKNKDIEKELKDYPLISAALQNLKADQNVKKLLNLNLNVFIKRAILVQFAEFKARKEILNDFGMEFRIKDDKGVERAVLDSAAMNILIIRAETLGHLNN